MTAVFEFDNTAKKFGREVALDGFSLCAEPGTVTALLGENGAGKTTALRILLGLLETDSGSSQVYGLDSSLHGEEIRHRVGYVPDQPSLYEWMTVDEIGWYCGGFYADGFVDKYRQLVAEFELPLKKRIKAMSKGMKAKVALSLSMAHEPELLVLDEPTSGLDPIVRRSFLESMVDVAASGRSVLLSSHQIQEVERVADTIAILRNGKLQVFEKLEDLKQDISELTVTLNNGATNAPSPPGTVIDICRQERQWRMLVRGCSEQQLEEFRSQEHVAGVEIRKPSLEDIYVGFMKSEIDSSQNVSA
jgi:ABC-2 type transport system ATP-binding protein